MKLNAIELKPRAAGLSRTLVLLHGYGADEHDLLPIAHELDPRLRAVSLQAPVALGGPMRAWFNLSQDARGISFDPDEARAGLQAARAAVEEIAAASPRPVLLGFTPPTRDGKVHDIDVRVAKRGLEPRARKSDIAPR